MTEAEWLSSDDPAAMLQHLMGRHGGVTVHTVPSERKLRLFACAVWRLVLSRRYGPQDKLCRSVRLAEQVADGQGWRDADTNCTVMKQDAAEAATDALYAEQECDGGRATRPEMAALLRDIVGNPFKAVTLPAGETCGRCCGAGVTTDLELCPGCGGHGDTHPTFTPTVRSLAQAAYDERQDDGTLDPARLAVLSDALEEAGCDSEPLLQHLRPRWIVRYEFAGATGYKTCPTEAAGRHAMREIEQHYHGMADVVLELPPPHVRGCWALDLILGKE